MDEVMPVDTAADLMNSQFLQQGKNTFTQNFGNIHLSSPEFTPQQTVPAFEQAAVRLHIKIVAEVIDDVRMRITILERPPVVPPGGFHRRLNA